MHVILQTIHSFLSNKRSVAVSSRQRGRCQLDMVNKLLIPANLCGRSSPDRNARAGVGVRCSRERTHVQSPNPGSRCARLAGAVHRDDRHLDPGTGRFVTVAVALNYRFPGSSALRLSLPNIPSGQIRIVRQKSCTRSMYVADLFKSRCRLEAENLFLRHQLVIALRRAPRRLRLRRSDRAQRIWMTKALAEPA